MSIATPASGPTRFAAAYLHPWILSAKPPWFVLFVQSAADMAPTPRPVVPRRLIDALHQGAAAPIQVVEAGAGWGKSTLLGEWAAEVSRTRPVVWVGASRAMSRSDLAAEILLHVHEADPAPPVARRLPPAAAADPWLLAAFTASALTRVRGNGVLILHDVHEFVDPDVTEFAGLTVRRLADTWHVVLSGRHMPPQVSEYLGLAFVPTLRASDLRLTTAETAESLEALLGSAPSEDVVEILHSRVDGWPGGIMAALRLANERGLGAAFDSGALAEALASYLDRAVLGPMPPETRTVLGEMAIVGPDFTTSLARCLTGSDSTGALMSMLDTAMGFISLTGQDMRTYHVMPVLAEHLRDQMARSRPTRARLLHLRAAQWFEQRDDIHVAIEHALAAADTVLAVELAGRHWLRYLKYGRETSVLAWLDAIDAASPRMDVSVAFIRGWLSGIKGHGAELDHALSILANNLDDPVVAGPCSVRCALALLNAAFVSRVGAAGVQQAEEALWSLQADSPWWVVAQCLLGYHLYWAGDPERAREVLVAATSARNLELRTVPLAVLLAAYGILGLIDAARRYAPGARLNAMLALDLATSAGLGDTPHVVPALVASALSHATSGHLREAETDLRLAALDAKNDRNGRYQALAYLATSRVRHLMGDRASAEQSLRSAQELIEDLPEATVLRVEADLAARTLRLRPRRVAALPDEPTPRELRVLEFLAAGLSRVEIAAELGVSTDTIKTHLRNLYLKLDANSRSTALDRARILGYVRPEDDGAGGRRGRAQAH